jgi:hypothetical protein
MTEFDITTESLGEDALFPSRTLRVNGKTARTPTKAIPVVDTREHEPVLPESRGVNELYQSVDDERLDKDLKRSQPQTVKKFRKAINKTQEGELNVAFIKYDEMKALPVVYADFLVAVQKQFSDFLTVPLLPQLARNIEPDENGLSDPRFGSYKKSILRFLEAAEEAAPDMPVMGVLPRLGWEYIDELMELYESHDVRAYCLNFDRTKPTAGAQVATVRPLMKSIANRGIENQVLFYGINIYPGYEDKALGARPAADLASVGMGFDIIGENHEPPRMPADVFEQMEEEGGSEQEPIEFRLFDKEEYLYRDLPLDELQDAFPADSALDVAHVVARARASPKNAKFRLQNLVNAEQMALATGRLRGEIESGSAYEHFTSKSGITASIADACEEVRADFDEGSGPGLGEF